jgi:hypothetical protein
MFDRTIYKSSVICNLATSNPEKELESQRVFQTLILIADDYGRGRLIPQVIRMEAFGTSPNVFSEITNEDILKWVEDIQSDGALEVYEVDGQKYYHLTGWSKYQHGKWRPRDSKIPSPPSEKKKRKVPKEKKEEKRREEKRRERKSPTICQESPNITKSLAIVEKKKQYLDCIFLTDAEHDKLKTRFSDSLPRALEVYDAWKTNTTKKKRDSIKSDYKSMLADWVYEKAGIPKQKQTITDKWEDGGGYE